MRISLYKSGIKSGDILGFLQNFLLKVGDFSRQILNNLEVSLS